MVLLKETINTKEELIEACKKGFNDFENGIVTKNDFCMFFGFTHGEAITKFYAKNYEQLLTDGGFNSGSVAYFSAGINAWKKLQEGIYELPPLVYRTSNPASNENNSKQKIYYGCPGAGKSYEVNKLVSTINHVAFDKLTTYERRGLYKAFLDAKNENNKGYRGGKTNFVALEHKKLMKYISACTDYSLNSMFDVSSTTDFDNIKVALDNYNDYKNDSITKGSNCHWETGLSSYREFLEQQKLQNNQQNKDLVFRTTFHPDTDYASFVGCYKPISNEGNIEYSFIPQVFTNAYMAAWENTDKPVYLVIEEINRGNCAQIFGDLFQLLDRDKKTGISEYSIKADNDLADYLEKALGVDHEGIKNRELRLPSNLIIYATMNTSDQSLFPMDSAFKRRWDWEYVPINYKDGKSSSFIIKIGKAEYSWVKFLKIINKKIKEITHSEDKQMGNYFIKDSITEKEFINKVMFYLWEEVCKEEYNTNSNFFRYKDGNEYKQFSFTELFDDDATEKLVGFFEFLKEDEKDGKDLVNLVSIEQ